MADFVAMLRGWFSPGSPQKPGQIHIRHVETGETVKRFRASEFEGRTPDEIAQRIVARAQSDASAWKGVEQTYHVQIYCGEGAQTAEETYAFGMAGESITRGRKGAALGATIGSSPEAVIAELQRVNATLVEALLRQTNIVGDWSETHLAGARTRINHLESERESVWVQLDTLRQADRDGQRAADERAEDAQRFKEGMELVTLVAPTVINRIVGYKLLPEKEGKLLSEFRGIFDELRNDSDTFEKLLGALQSKPAVQARLVSMFDKFLTDEERTTATKALIDKTKALPPKQEAAE